MPSAGDVWKTEAQIVPAEDEGQGGHAGNTVSSIEEISRPGTNYLVTKNGNITYHGKSFAPEETPRGGAHVTVLPGGHVRVNEGVMTDIMHLHLKRALKKN